MSQLATARRQLSSIKSLIRQEKFLSAVQTLRDDVITVFREPLMKAEKEEFERLISDASYHIVCDPHVRKSAALEIKYEPGKEREFLDGLNMLLETFDGQFQDDARESARLLEEKKRLELERGQQKLDAGQVDAARAVFSILVRENQEDYELRRDIGERFLRAGEYEDAIQYLGEALEGMPGAAHIYNSLAVAQRKMGKYAEAEQSYIKAAKGGYKDSHLFFNMGRLYVDWKKWDKAVKAAQGALQMDPDFTEARKLMAYAEKMRDRGL